MESVQCPSTTDRVRLLCSYGGRILLRRTCSNTHYNYSGGETKILIVDRCIGFSEALAKVSCLYSNGHVFCYFKYQLPGEGLDALITVSNDEDFDQMMFEYDQLCLSEGKSARLRIFLYR